MSYELLELLIGRGFMIKGLLKVFIVLGVVSLASGSFVWASGYGSPSGGYDYGRRRESREFPTYDAAIKKYDAVAYFEEGKASKGVRDIYYIWKGKKWYFKSKKHEKLFVKNPEKYIPQYKGYCAYALSQGSLAKANPKVFSLVDGKLYFNVSKKIQKKWESQKSSYIKLADQQWLNLSPQSIK